MNQPNDMDWMAAGGEQGHRPNSSQKVPGGIMDVLSASTYGQALDYIPDPAAPQQYFGGLISDEDEQDQSQSQRKRARRTKSDPSKSVEGTDETSKKQRGRPRVENPAQSAVDRRRTQIRLAQRAYRERKESTITSLQERVDQMQNTMMRVSSLLEDLSNTLTKSTILDEQSDTNTILRRMKEELQEAIKSQTPEPDIPENAAKSPESRKGNPAPASPQKKLSRAATSSRASVEASPDVADEDAHMTELALSKSTPISATDLYDTNIPNMPSQDPGSYFDLDIDILDFNRVIDADKRTAGSLQVERTFPMQTAYTYSFQETTFARRLHRFALERAFRFLASPDIDPVWVNRSFGFTMSLLGKAQLRRYLKEILQRKAGEDLEDWSLPYYHVGGAGTHYPRRDATGKPLFPPNLQSPRRAHGPWVLTYNPTPLSDEQVQKGLESIGFGGQWFDPHDAEEYLKTKGIHLDGQTSFVEVDVSKVSKLIKSDQLPHGMTTTPPASHNTQFHQSLPGKDSNINTKDALIVNTVDNSQERTLTGSGAIDTFRMINAWWDDYSTPTSGSSHRTMNPTTSKLPGFKETVTLDVEKLIQRMLNGAACMGRAPGLRRESVDNALSLALVEAF